MAPAEFLRKHKDIVRLLKSGQSVRNAATIAGKGVSTVQRVKGWSVERESPTGIKQQGGVLI